MVPAAEVEVINDGTGATRRVTTSSAGVFNVPNLDLGSYKLRVSGQGFNTYERTGLNLAANQIINIDVQLSLGATSTLMEVHGASPVISTETIDLSGTVSHETMEALPLVGRHTGDGGVYSYVTLTTGGSAIPGSSTPIIGGTRSQVGILPTMDGIAVMAFPQGASPVQPSMEGIQEVKIETAVAPAEFGAAGNVQVISKSGTNDFHGGGFWDWNGSRLNARNFFTPTVPFRVYNNFATSLGGPIKKNKLFFFVDYEGSRESAKVTLTENVPLPAWKAGNFSSGNTRQLTDPTTGQAFPGNIIPTARLSQVSQNIQSYAYPDPNFGAPGAVASNWTGNFPGKTGFTHYDHMDYRADYNATDHDILFARVSWRRMPLKVSGVPYPLYRIQDRHGQSTVLAWNHTISPAAFNEFRFGTTYHRNHYEADVLGTDLLQKFGITGVPTTGVRTGPYFNITGVTPFSPDNSSFNFQDNPETTLQWIDNLSWTRGRHFLKFGFDAVRDRSTGIISIPSSTANMTSAALTPGSDTPIFCWGFHRSPRCPFRIPTVT